MSTTTDEPIVRQPGVPFQERPYTAEDGVQFVVRAVHHIYDSYWGYVRPGGAIVQDLETSPPMFIQDVGLAMKFRTVADACSFLADVYRIKKHKYIFFFLEIMPVKDEAPTGV